MDDLKNLLSSSFVIGSWALKAYGLLDDRSPSDLDLLSIQHKQRFYLHKTMTEVRSTSDLLEKTNEVLFDYSEKNWFKRINTPIGNIRVAPLEVLKVLKMSSLVLGKNKHYWDLAKLKGVFIPKELHHIISLRKEETLKRLEKDKFFNRYSIPRYIDHDELHSYVAKNPAYKKLLMSETMVSEEKFNKLSFKEKYLELFEETMVLTIERELIPRYRALPVGINDLIRKFGDSTSSDTPSRIWLNRLTVDGRVKDRPNWLSSWGRENYEKYIHFFDAWWEETLNNLSVEFWERFLKTPELSPFSREQ